MDQHQRRESRPFQPAGPFRQERQHGALPPSRPLPSYPHRDRPAASQPTPARHHEQHRPRSASLAAKNSGTASAPPLAEVAPASGRPYREGDSLFDESGPTIEWTEGYANSLFWTQYQQQYQAQMLAYPSVPQALEGAMPMWQGSASATAPASQTVDGATMLYTDNTDNVRIRRKDRGSRQSDQVVELREDARNYVVGLPVEDATSDVASTIRPTRRRDAATVAQSPGRRLSAVALEFVPREEQQQTEIARPRIARTLAIQLAPGSELPTARRTSNAAVSLSGIETVHPRASPFPHIMGIQQLSHAAPSTQNPMRYQQGQDGKARIKEEDARAGRAGETAEEAVRREYHLELSVLEFWEWYGVSATTVSVLAD